MSVKTRKERERGQREELILQQARRLLLRDGYQAFNLDELAKAIEYSKGTIYLHFETKEDLVLGVSTQALAERVDFFERAVQLTGRSRERMHAIGVANCQFAISHPDYFNVELMLKSVSFWEKASRKRQEEHSMYVGKCFHTVRHLVQQAIDDGDLAKDGYTPEDVTLGLFAITMGSHIMLCQSELRLLAGVTDSMTVLRRNQEVMLDGFGWRPYLKEFDYQGTDRRIFEEVFPEAEWLVQSN